MQEQGSPDIDPYLSILVASGPQDELAIALVQTLRDAGLRVIFAQTVTLAARVAGDACCLRCCSAPGYVEITDHCYDYARQTRVLYSCSGGTDAAPTRSLDTPAD